jgi:hypothetical protein
MFTAQMVRGQLQRGIPITRSGAGPRKPWDQVAFTFDPFVGYIFIAHFLCSKN